MTQKPDSKLNPDAQQWARWVEQNKSEQDIVNQMLYNELERLFRGEGGQANQYASLVQSINLLRQELVFLYNAMGTPYPPTPAGPPVVPPTPTSKTIEVGASWSRTWGTSSYYTGSDEHTNGSYLYQGSNPENKVGMVRFDVGEAFRKTITSASLWLHNINSPYSGVFTAHLGTHSESVAPTAKPGRINGFDVGWSRGEGKWHPLPSWAYDGLSNGSIQGFTVGASGPSDADYAYFQGAGMGSAPKLRLTFNT